MKFTAFILLSVLGACGAKQSSHNYGKTTVADLIAEKGQPVEEQKIPIKESKILIYPENEKYQVENDIVTHGLRDPKGDEKLVVFWKHKFKNCTVKDQIISSKNAHTAPEHQMRCDSLGLTIIYGEGSSYVSRIIEHEKK